MRRSKDEFIEQQDHRLAQDYEEYRNSEEQYLMQHGQECNDCGRFFRTADITKFPISEFVNLDLCKECFQFQLEHHVWKE